MKAAVFLLLFLAACSQSNGYDAVIFKSSSCGCCGAYSQYMASKGYNVNVEVKDNMQKIKAENEIPAQIESCHTTKVGGYFVEGHVPVEAIDKLLAEKPDIKGIGMAGMPSGSPGMPGPKQGTWIIYAVNNDNTIEEFMRI